MLENGPTAILEALYGAALEPLRWREALSLVVDQFDGAGGAFEYVSHGTGDFQVNACIGVDIELITTDPRFADWPLYDPWAAALSVEPYDDLVRGTQFVSAADYRNSIFHNEYAAPAGAEWRDALAVAPKMGAGVVGIFSIYRPWLGEDFDRADVELMGRLRPHILAAMKINQRFGELTAHAGALEAALEGRADAVLVLDAQRRVVACNARARALFSGAGRILRIQRGVLRLVDIDADRRFQDLIGPILASDRSPAAGLHAARSVMWEAPLTNDRYCAHVTPHLRAVAPELSALGRAEPALVVSICDFRRDAAAIAERMRAAFDLTKAETALVARLIAGARLADVCEERGVAMNTVKTHLKAVFQKAQVSSQAELMRLALTGF